MQYQALSVNISAYCALMFILFIPSEYALKQNVIHVDIFSRYLLFLL